MELEWTMMRERWCGADGMRSACQTPLASTVATAASPVPPAPCKSRVAGVYWRVMGARVAAAVTHTRRLTVGPTPVGRLLFGKSLPLLIVLHTSTIVNVDETISSQFDRSEDARCQVEQIGLY